MTGTSRLRETSAEVGAVLKARAPGDEHPRGAALRDPRALIVELCRQFYTLGWVSGTGGGVSLKQADRIYMAPSGVSKERLDPQDIFELDERGHVLRPPPDPGHRLSECAPLFMAAYTLRDAGAVVHSHAMNALLVTLLYETAFRCSRLEMIKGIQGHGYHDELVVPIVDNTPHERQLTGRISDAIR
ncbi:MAG: class II aldolase/adducin family protein, partial [Proteobacteria bacterium]|nr:class II aldolase/adducin family protein [Pseudomonadota bacterium]